MGGGAVGEPELVRIREEGRGCVADEGVKFVGIKGVVLVMWRGVVVCVCGKVWMWVARMA